MRSWLACILVFLVSAPLLAQTAAKSQTTTTTTTTTTTPKTTTAKKKAAPAKKAPSAASEMKTLREAVNAQQQQIQMLRDELSRRDQAVQQMQGQINQLQSTANQAQTAAQSAASSSKQNEDALAALKTNVATVETKATATATGLQSAEKSIKGLESPLALKYKGITIRPGGFVAMYGLYRNHNTGSDATSNLGSFPLQDTGPQAHLGEFRMTARHSNLSLRADGVTQSGLKTTAYFEIDFEGSGVGANEVISSSFNPRVREAWANVETKGGTAFLAGQTWSLLTPNIKGIAPANEKRPATIDASYLVGYHYARLASFRVTKKVNDKAWIAFAVENPEQKYATTGAPANVLTAGVQGTGFSAAVTTDPAPDFVGKAAFETGIAHIELGGIGRFFRDRVITNVALKNGGNNNITAAGGGTFNVIVHAVPKKVDILLNTLAGKGIGRYGVGGGPDVAIKPDGTMQSIMGGIAMFGIEGHPTGLTDVYLYAGAEYYDRTVFGTTGSVGYGTRTGSQVGCFTEGGTPCNADNRAIFEITPVIWHSFYKGPAGTFRVGAEYEWVRRSAWRSTTALSPNGVPYGTEHVAFAAVRWFFP